MDIELINTALIERFVDNAEQGGLCLVICVLSCNPDEIRGGRRGTLLHHR